jgi:hypothetical protein
VLSQDQLRNLEIFDWNDRSKHFEGADILLGNGFSMNFAAGFHYNSLFGEFLKDCSASEITIFQSFNTSNFEAIQQELLGAVHVNTLFNLPTNDITKAIDRLRAGLISTIERTHPRANQIDRDQLWSIAQQLTPFNNIFTLNYDLYLYHLIMMAKDIYESGADPEIRPYNDYFWMKGEEDDHYLKFVDYQRYTHYKHVYYLHGALFIFPGFYNDLKLKRYGDDELIDCVATQIHLGRMPLFVSEANWKEKLQVINRSTYLSFARSNLKDAETKLVVYGTSLSSQHDKHIIDAIREKQHDIAVAIYVGNKTEDALRQEVFEFKGKLVGHDVLFFDSSTLFQF